MKVSPLDLKQQRFNTAIRGFDKVEVTSFLLAVADDYEQALRDADRLRQDVSRLEALVAEHREHEKSLTTTLVTAQRLSDEIRSHAEEESSRVVREAQGRADLLLQKTQARLEDVQREIDGLKLKRKDVETSIEATIQTLKNTLEYVRDQDAQEREERLLLHRRWPTPPEDQSETPSAPSATQQDSWRAKGRGEPPFVIRATGSGVEIDVRVIPRARRSGLHGIRQGAFLITLTAPPVDGAANDALVAFLARILGVPRRHVTIASGDKGRQKRVCIAGIDAALVSERLGRGSPAAPTSDADDENPCDGFSTDPYQRLGTSGVI